jgi:amidase
MKPTVGLTSRHGVIPISAHQDSVGPMARTVKDAAYLLSAIAGYDINDNYTAQIPWTIVPDYVGACKLGGLNGVKVGVLRQLFPSSSPTSNPVIQAATSAAIRTMTDLGAIVTDVTIPQYDTDYSKRAAVNEGIILR